jgi:hypothetical protein
MPFQGALQYPDDLSAVNLKRLIIKDHQRKS